MNDELIQAANYRLRCDDVWTATRHWCFREVDLHEALNEAFELLSTKGKPELLIVPWTVGIALLYRYYKEVSYRMDSGGHPYEDMPLEVEKSSSLQEKGYLGKYRGALVVASIHASFMKPFGILATTSNPRDINSNGSNCILLDFSR